MSFGTMAEFLNHNSFLLSLVGLWGFFIAYLLRSSPRQKRLSTIAVVTLALAALYFALSPRQASGNESSEILEQIGKGTPVLLEFKSPN